MMDVIHVIGGVSQKLRTPGVSYSFRVTASDAITLDCAVGAHVWRTHVS